MTTIVCRNGVMAADSLYGRVENEDKSYRNKIKTRKIHGIWHAFAGTGTQRMVDILTDWACNGFRDRDYPKKSSYKEENASSTVVYVQNKDALFRMAVGDKTRTYGGVFWDNYWSVGSGCEPANFYMKYKDVNAIEAVVKSCKYTDTTDWPISYWMDGWKKPKIITKAEWQANKEFYRSLGR